MGRIDVNDVVELERSAKICLGWQLLFVLLHSCVLAGALAFTYGLAAIPFVFFGSVLAQILYFIAGGVGLFFSIALFRQKQQVWIKWPLFVVSLSMVTIEPMFRLAWFISLCLKPVLRSCFCHF